MGFHWFQPNGQVCVTPCKQGGIAHFLIGSGLVNRAKLRQFLVGNLAVFPRPTFPQWDMLDNGDTVNLAHFDNQFPDLMIAPDIVTLCGGTIAAVILIDVPIRLNYPGRFDHDNQRHINVAGAVCKCRQIRLKLKEPQRIKG